MPLWQRLRAESCVEIPLPLNSCFGPGSGIGSSADSSSIGNTRYLSRTAGRETFFVADFYCHEYRLAVEIDGRVHDDQKEHDKVRTLILNQKGVRVIRFKNRQIERELEVVMKRLDRYVQVDATVTHPPPLSRQKAAGSQT